MQNDDVPRHRPFRQGCLLVFLANRPFPRHWQHRRKGFRGPRSRMLVLPAPW